MARVTNFNLVEHKLLAKEQVKEFLTGLDNKARKRHLPLTSGQIAEFTGNLYADTTDCIHEDGSTPTKVQTISIELKREDGLIFCVSPTTFCTKTRVDANANLVTLKGEFADGEIPSVIVNALTKGQKIQCNEKYITFSGSTKPMRIVTLTFMNLKKQKNE